MKQLTTVLLVLCCFAARAQSPDPYTNFGDCPIGGQPCSHDDSMKNRHKIPADKSAYKKIDFKTLQAMKVTGRIPAEFIAVRGYCILVKPGGSETCNCKTKDQAYEDTHIEITIDNKHTKNTDAVIAEVNGRVRDIKSKKGVDWSTKTLKKEMMGHYVTIYGQGFFDDHHKQNAVADEPDGTDLWRATTLEIHPVLEIEIEP